MEAATETWRVKHPKNWPARTDREDAGDHRLPDTKSRVELLKDAKKKRDPTLCFLAKKRRCRSRSRDPSLHSLSTSINDNCCICCGLIARYVHDVFQCLYCIGSCRIPACQDLHFQEMFGEMMDTACEMCRDLFTFIRKFLQMCVGMKK